MPREINRGRKGDREDLASETQESSKREKSGEIVLYHSVRSGGEKRKLRRDLEQCGIEISRSLVC